MRLSIVTVRTKSGLSGSEVECTQTKIWYVSRLCFYLYPDTLHIKSFIKGVAANISIWGIFSYKKQSGRVETLTAILNVFICFTELDSDYLRHFWILIWVYLEGS